MHRPDFILYLPGCILRKYWGCLIFFGNIPDIVKMAFSADWQFSDPGDENRHKTRFFSLLEAILTVSRLSGGMGRAMLGNPLWGFTPALKYFAGFKPGRCWGSVWPGGCAGQAAGRCATGFPRLEGRQPGRESKAAAHRLPLQPG